MIKDHKYHHTHTLPLNDKGFLDMKKVKDTFYGYFEKKVYGRCLDYLNFIKNKGELRHHKDILQLHQLYIEVLLEIEDYPSLVNILFSKEKYLETSKEKAIHYFYLAIAYEGLNQVEKAIQSLKKIDESISRQNLTNKYLKLALLYLRQKKLKAAKEAYQHAKIFDPEMKNDIFLLVQSDIYYQEGQYIDAMKVYEDFFIQTKRQWSFLNRFIRISLALDRQKDAYDFYQRYKDKVINQSSIHSKKLFFREILPLLKTHYPQAFIEANNQLMEIEKRTPLQFDDYNYYHMILNHLSNHTIYEKKRDMIRDLLIDLHKTGAFMKLLYMQLNDGEIKIYHLSKKLLLEKTIDNQHAIYEDMRGHQTKATYTREEIKGFEFVEGTMDYLFVEAVEEDGYLLAYIKQEHYDLSKKLTTLTKHLLKEKINDLTIRKSQKNQSDALRKIMDMNHQAVFKLHHHQMVPLNNSAKQMLGRGHTMMAYHNFQEQVTPMIYIDQLMENKQFDIVFQETDYRLNPVCIEYDVYLMFEKLEKHIRTTDTEWQAKPTDSILLVDIRNHQALTTMLGFKTVNQHLKALIEQVPKLSNMHLKDTIVEANHLLYLLLDTRDKRISERLSKKINSAMGHLVDLRFAYINFNTDFNNAKDKLLDMISQTSLTKTGIFSEKIIRINQEKDQLYIKTIQSMIQSNAINLIDYHVKDWTKQSTQYHYLSIDDLHILKEKKRLRRIFNDQALAIEFDRLVVNQLIAKAKKLKYPRPWILPLNKASIESKKAFNYLLRRFDILEDHQIIIRLEDASYQTLSDKDKQYLHDKHVSICLENITIDVQRLRHQTTIDYLVIQPDVFEASFLEDMMPLLKKRFKQIIYNHHDQKLFKAKLTRHNIQLIMGAFSGKEKL